MKIRVLFSLWKRPEVTEFCFDGMDRLIAESKHDIRVSCVLSEKEFIPLCEERGYDWIFEENLPVGKKLNTGIKSTLGFEYDYLMMMNSDNIIEKELLENVYDPFFESMNPFFGVNKVTYVNFGTTEAVDFTYDFSVLGIAKMIRKDKVEQLKGELYEDQRSRGLDDSMLHRMTKNDIWPTTVEYKGQLAFDFKSEVNIHPWEKFKDRGTKVCYSLK